MKSNILLATMFLFGHSLTVTAIQNINKEEQDLFSMYEKCLYGLAILRSIELYNLMCDNCFDYLDVLRSTEAYKEMVSSNSKLQSLELSLKSTDEDISKKDLNITTLRCMVLLSHYWLYHINFFEKVSKIEDFQKIKLPKILRDKLTPLKPELEEILKNIEDELEKAEKQQK